MKKLFIGISILSLLIVTIIGIWLANLPTPVSVMITVSLWLCAGVCGVIMLRPPPLRPHLYWGKPVWDTRRIIGFCCMIGLGPITLSFITVIAHPYFLHDKSVREIMGY